MKCGYKYQQDGKLTQLVCNDNKQWYRRSSVGGGFSAWVAIFPPIIRCGRLEVGNGVSVALSPLSQEPPHVPQR